MLEGNGGNGELLRGFGTGPVKQLIRGGDHKHGHQLLQRIIKQIFCKYVWQQLQTCMATNAGRSSACQSASADSGISKHDRARLIELRVFPDAQVAWSRICLPLSRPELTLDTTERDEQLDPWNNLAEMLNNRSR